MNKMILWCNTHQNTFLQLYISCVQLICLCI